MAKKKRKNSNYHQVTSGSKDYSNPKVLEAKAKKEFSRISQKLGSVREYHPDEIRNVDLSSHSIKRKIKAVCASMPRIVNMTKDLKDKFPDAFSIEED